MTEIVEQDDYPLAATAATRMLSRGLERAQAERGLTQRDVARELGYKSSVVLSHMALGRVPIPVDRVQDISQLLDLDLPRFLVAVLQQRHPNIDFISLFGAAAPSTSGGEVAAELTTIAGVSLDELDRGTIEVLREVVAAADPRRRWISLLELSIVEVIRAAMPSNAGYAPTREKLAGFERCLEHLKEGKRR